MGLWRPPAAVKLRPRMDAPATERLPQSALESRRSRRDRVGDLALYGLSAAASFLAVFLIGLLIYKIFEGAWPSITHFGVPFVWEKVWDENSVPEVYGALSLIDGTAFPSASAPLIAAPLSIAIGLYLSELAPGGVRGVVGALVEMLAAIPSVIIGLWGILVLGPFVQKDLEPFLGSFLGWLPI